MTENQEEKDMFEALQFIKAEVRSVYKKQKEENKDNMMFAFLVFILGMFLGLSLMVFFLFFGAI